MKLHGTESTDIHSNLRVHYFRAIGFPYSLVDSISRRRRVGVVEKLYVFPLKSGKAHSAEALHFDILGPRHLGPRGMLDRTFMIVNEEKKAFFDIRYVVPLECRK